MEWINPKYTDIVAALRAHQAARPDESCVACDGQGEKLTPEPHGASRVSCRACDGTGRRPAAVRGFVLT